MKVITSEPMTVDEVFKLTGKDAVYDLDGFKVRILNYSAGQEVDANLIKKDSKSGLTFGLKKVEGQERYKYMAFLIK